MTATAGHREGSGDQGLVTFATNNGDIGGGEVMLLRLAEAAEKLGWTVQVVGPPGGLVVAAASAGRAVHVIRAHDRTSYLVGLRRWARRNEPGLLWCNGLVPALATASRRDRVIHLHQQPSPSHSALATVARRRARATLVPSDHLARQVPGALALPNWCDPVRVPQRSRTGGAVRIGFLGRVSVDKGVDLLADAASRLIARGHDLRLVVAGSARFAGAASTRTVNESLARLGPRLDELGWVTREDFFAQVDVAVFPSRVPEAFGLVVAEAMSARVPFVVSDAGALPEVAGAQHPWISRAGDAEHLAAVIGAALAALPATEVLDAAEARWRAHYSPEAGSVRLAALLSGLRRLGGHP